MRLKDSTVKVEGVHADVWPPLFELDGLWRKKAGYELVVTSARDGKHSDTSDHYWGGAVDVRTWTNANSGQQLKGKERSELLSSVKESLGAGWFVLDERNHFHLSYRPRKP